MPTGLIPISGGPDPRYQIVGAQPVEQTQFFTSWPPNTYTIQIYAHGAEWRPAKYQKTIQVTGHSDIVWQGGLVLGQYAVDAHWDNMHNQYAMTFNDCYNLVLFGVRMDNVGDGINLNGGCDEFIISGNHLSWVRDNAIQNDFGCGGWIENNLIDGAWAPYSSRPYKADVPDNSGKVVYFYDNLVSLKHMTNGFEGKNGTGRFWKLDNASQAGYVDHPRDPKLAIVNNVFYLEALPVCCGDFVVPPISRCVESSGNILVWGGPLPVPSKIMSELVTNPGYSLSTDRLVWQAAREVWLANNGPIRQVYR